MRLFVDTSVWSLALRRDAPPSVPEVDTLRKALGEEAVVVTTGLVLQELLQGFHGPRAQERLVEDFSALPLVVPDRSDHVQAAGLRNACRRRGIQVGTIAALLAQLCLHHDLTLLTTDDDFARMAGVCSLSVWKP